MLKQLLYKRTMIKSQISDRVERENLALRVFYKKDNRVAADLLFQQTYCFAFWSLMVINLNAHWVQYQDENLEVTK